MLNCTNKRSAFVAIVGVPNVGKSSLLNIMIGQKISIVSSKPQTTRNKIMGILTQGNTQLVFIDTPGIHKPKNQLGNYMIKSIKSSISSVDAYLLVVEAGRSLCTQEIEIIRKIANMKLPAIVALNKIDTLPDKSVLLSQMKALSKFLDFEAILPVSAKCGDGIHELIEELEKIAVIDGHFFNDNDLTDQPERTIVSEIIREKILNLLDKEVPHGIAVCIDKMRERESGDLIDIYATVYCEKNSHKGILIGKHGSMLKKIGSSSRVDIEHFLDTKINLQIWIKVKEDWRNNSNLLRNFGFNEKDLRI